MCNMDAKTMTYQELQDLCDEKRTSVTAVAAEIGITFDGLKKGVAKESLSMTSVMKLCKVLGIDPNTFCRWDKQVVGDVNYGNMQKGGKKNTITIGSSEELRKTIDMLEQELKTKNEQIAKLIEKL